MPNHMHLVAVPEHNDSLTCAIRDAHGMYASYFNRTYGLERHLWQGRYFSCAMDPDHTTTAVRYVERNPVRAGIVDRAQDYEWSSAAAHCGVRCDSLLPDEFLPRFWPADWSAWLDESDLTQDAALICRKTRSRSPLGSDDFVTDLEQRLGYPL